MAQDSKSRKLDQYIVRFPDGMRDRIKAAADANNRSMNAEIVSKLERYDSLGGEVDAIWEVARALAAEIDAASGHDATLGPLVDKIADAFDAVDDLGNVDRAKLGREYSEDASRRLSGAVHVPPALLDRISAKAERAGRSINAEIISALEEAYPAGYSLSSWLDDWMGLINDPDALSDDLRTKAELDAKRAGFQVIIERSAESVDRPEIRFIPIENYPKDG